LKEDIPMNTARIKSLLPLVALILLVVAWPGKSQGTHSITLAWTPGTGGGAVASYTVKRSTTSGTESTLQTGVTTTTFADTTGVAGTKYFYVVTAVNAFGESAPSNEVSATFLGDRPAAPAGLSAVAQ
jgi:cellulose 1,4-beta-cellobiosidase